VVVRRRQIRRLDYWVVGWVLLQFLRRKIINTVITSLLLQDTDRGEIERETWVPGKERGRQVEDCIIQLTIAVSPPTKLVAFTVYTLL
jgi:hypothetical protein